MTLFKTLALAGLVFCAAPAPVLAAPAATAEAVSAFAKPTQAERLATLKALLDARGLKYEVQAFTSGKPGVPEGYNVVVTLGQGDKDILLTAHYDAEVLKDGRLVDGVVDNAASVVALVKAAEQLKGGLENHRLRVVFFDQEELGLLGAFAYAQGPDAARTAAVVNFDVNAYGDTPFFYAGEGEVRTVIQAKMATACDTAKQSCVSFDSYPPSDHLAFRRAGILATSISILPRAEALDLQAFMADPKAAKAPPRVLSLIHTPQDTMANVDPKTVERAAAMAVAAAKAFDAR